MSWPPFPREFFARPAWEVAPGLLGAVLVGESPEGVVAGRLVEVEAYDGPQDRASHARAGRTSRTAPMFGPPGHAYVFLVYGMYYCLNVVTAADGEAGAILLRAAAPLVGAGLMRARRGRPHEIDARLAAGPGRLGAAFAIDRSCNGVDLTMGPLRLVLVGGAWPGAAVTAGVPVTRLRERAVVAGPRESADPLESAVVAGPRMRAVVAGPRIGVAYAGEPWASLPWRFYLRGDPSVSV